MKQYTIKRDGQRNLTFQGELIAEAHGRWQNGREQNRWTDLTLYKTAGGKYVLQNEYNTQWQGEANSDDAWVLATAQEVYDKLTEDAIEHDSEQPLGRLDKELLEDAAKADPAFAALLVEAVD